MALDDITTKIKGKVESNGAIAGKIIAFEFPDIGCLVVDGKSDPAIVSNEMCESDCVITLDFELFTDIVSGAQNPQMAFMSGKIQVKGDMSLAMKLGDLLG